MRPRHVTYWTAPRRSAVESFGPTALADRICDAPKTIGQLDAAPQPPLSWFARLLAWFTTPFKRLGISGWTETGCWAVGAGSPVRDAQWSTDGFWTVDVSLDAFTIGDRSAPAGRYVRLEIEPDTHAHRVAAKERITPSHRLEFAGPVLVDEDGPFLEVHPDREFRAAPARSGAGAVPHVPSRA